MAKGNVPLWPCSIATLVSRKEADTMEMTCLLVTIAATRLVSVDHGSNAVGRLTRSLDRHESYAAGDSHAGGDPHCSLSTRSLAVQTLVVPFHKSWSCVPAL